MMLVDNDHNLITNQTILGRLAHLVHAYRADVRLQLIYEYMTFAIKVNLDFSKGEKREAHDPIFRLSPIEMWVCIKFFLDYCKDRSNKAQFELFVDGRFQPGL
uniref:Uncharacterized protein n=1 Tax=Opuntia streptacantha TaxID=393608 RepID=A0A7C9AWB7_OPUST